MRRGVVATLAALALLAGVDAHPAAADDEGPAYDRSDVLWEWEYGGPGVRRAAEAVLLSPDQDVDTFLTSSPS